MAVDGLIDGFYSEGEADETAAGVEKDVEKGEENGVSSKVLRNMDEMDWLQRNTQTTIQQS